MRYSNLCTLPTKMVAFAFVVGVSTSTAHAIEPDASNFIQYVRKDLVSDLPGVASHQDPSLVNPWGIAFFPGGPFWVSDNGKGVATIYDGLGVKSALTVTIPAPKKAATGFTSSPTGQVANVTANFVIPVGSTTAQPAKFIFATEDGTISAWNGSGDATKAVLVVDNSAAKAVYKGLTIGTNVGGNYLFATNFFSGKVDVFDKSFLPVTLPKGAFVDPIIPAGYAPFGIANIDGDLFVTFAKQNTAKHDDVAGPGHGFVDVFDTSGQLLRRFAAGGSLNSPWAVVAAPLGFGIYGGSILVGNFGDGRINIFTPSGGYRLQLSPNTDQVFEIDGLWALTFGGATNSNPDTLFYTSGPNGEKHGLFGSITPVLQPAP